MTPGALDSDPGALVSDPGALISKVSGPGALCKPRVSDPPALVSEPWALVSEPFEHTCFGRSRVGLGPSGADCSETTTLLSHRASKTRSRRHGGEALK